MDLSFHEKSLWLLLTSLILMFGVYFAMVLPAQGADVLPHQVGLFIALLVGMIVVQGIGHAVLAIANHRELTRSGLRTDERDRLIGLKATRNGSWVLATGVFFSLCVALLIEGTFAFTHALLAFWVLAQLVEIGSQLVLYRRGS